MVYIPRGNGGTKSPEFGVSLGLNQWTSISGSPDLLWTPALHPEVTKRALWASEVG